MGKQRRLLPDLPPAQQEILDCIWQHGELSASALRTLLAPRRDVARNTVRKLLERMVEKGWLTYRQEGRTFLYSPAQPKQTTVGERIVDLVDRACGGSAETLVAALLDARGLSRQELARIRKMLDETPARGTSNTKGGK